MADLEKPLSQDTRKLLDHLESQSGFVERLDESPRTLVLYTDPQGRTHAVLTPTGLRSLRARLDSPVLKDAAFFREPKDRM